MRALFLVLLTLSCASGAVATDSGRDLGVVLFESWPRDLPALEQGIPVRWVVPKSPAAQAGFKPGDVILNIDLFAVTRESLAQRWIDKTTGAAGCIPFKVLRTELKPKGWRQETLCVPVRSWTMPQTADADAATQVPVATIGGDVEKPGIYLLTRQSLADAIAASVPTGGAEQMACSVAGAVSPSNGPPPPDGCARPLDAQWKSWPSNRSCRITVMSRTPTPALSVFPSAGLTVTGFVDGQAVTAVVPDMVTIIRPPDGGRQAGR